MERDKKGRFVKGSIPKNAFPKGHIPWMKGRKHTEESIIKNRLSHLSKKVSEETRLKMSLARKGFRFSSQSIEKMRLSALGKIRSEESKEKNRLAHLGNTYCLGHKHTEETKRKMTLSRIGKFVGEKSWNWKGGKTPLNRRIRMSYEYRSWRTKVFERDNYTCQMCGKKGGKLHAHHIKLFSEYPELRFEVSNGITYCKEPCHKTKGLHKKTKKLKAIA